MVTDELPVFRSTLVVVPLTFVVGRVVGGCVVGGCVVGGCVVGGCAVGVCVVVDITLDTMNIIYIYRYKINN